MASWLEELERREASARERAEELRRRIGELSEELAAEEQQLSRLQVTRETMLEILSGAPDLAGDVRGVVGVAGDGDRDAGGGQELPGDGGGSRIGVMLVPSRESGTDGVALPQSYRDILEIVGDAGRPLRAGHVAAALGISQDRSAVEALRAKLKRLTARGWLDEATPGLFTIAGDN
ncbi:hypothetical protein AB0L63_29060 [Nocardia sp. NPDC051990]|uniref:hypothetical protein n=1 Tax=Nocardia sp. NPDC051990 TaxID=3155285 RepID=UPI00341D51BF